MGGYSRDGELLFRVDYFAKKDDHQWSSPWRLADGPHPDMDKDKENNKDGTRTGQQDKDVIRRASTQELGQTLSTSAASKLSGGCVIWERYVRK